LNLVTFELGSGLSTTILVAMHRQGMFDALFAFAHVRNLPAVEKI
jgi:hypothetical protein